MTAMQIDLSKIPPIPVKIVHSKNNSSQISGEAKATNLGTYKEKPVINMFQKNNKPFSIGLAKAETIVRNYKQIEAFVKSEGKSIDVIEQ